MRTDSAWRSGGSLGSISKTVCSARHARGDILRRDPGGRHAARRRWNRIRIPPQLAVTAISSVITSPMPASFPMIPIFIRRSAHAVCAAAPKSATKAASSPFLRLPAKNAQGMPARTAAVGVVLWSDTSDSLVNSIPRNHRPRSHPAAPVPAPTEAYCAAWRVPGTAPENS